MSKRATRGRAGRLEVGTPDASRETYSEEGDERILLGRQVEGSSIVDLNKATHGLGKRTPRVLDVFSMGLVYAYKLRDAREHSPLENPPNVKEMTERFSKLPERVASLAQPVAADVVGVRSYRGEVAVYVDYPSLVEEQFIMAEALSRYLDLPQPHSPGPNESRIVIIEDELSRGGQVSRIESALPEQIQLSALRPIK